jgi:hypothetical protein
LGMEILRLREKGDVTRYASCLILTDGQPNVEPPRGHIPTLRKYRDLYVTLPCSIHTFGFGYGIESVLLTDIAKEGGGGYVFIPDGGFVGTAFVNTASNLLTTLADHVEVLVETAPHVHVEKREERERGEAVSFTLGGFPVQHSSWGATVQLGTLHFGQSRSVVVPLIAPKNVDLKSLVSSVTVRYDLFDKTKGSLVIEGGEGVAGGEVDRLDKAGVEEDLCRVYALDAMRTALHAAAEGKYDESLKTIKSTVGFIEKTSAANRPIVIDLVKDLKGQVTEAFSKEEWFTRWGRHYVPSLSLSHSSQVCSNFKDPGLQHYGGALFKKMQDELDTIFLSLPPPQPSNIPRQEYGYSSYSSHSSSSPAAVSMAAYYNSGNPCFAGSCLVLMADGSMKRVDEIRKGDLVHGGREADSAEILCVVKTKIRNASPRMVHLPCGLIVTEYHPIRPDGMNWVFPIHMEEKVVQETPGVPFIYSFVMKTAHVMVIQGMECVGLGHSFTENDVIRHPYFGSERIRKDLERMDGWKDGVVEFEEGPLVRNASTSLVDGIREEYFASCSSSLSIESSPFSHVLVSSH